MNISFVIPAYNSGKTLRDSVTSIVNKGNFHRGDEIIIVNDCSTDNSSKIINEIKSEFPFIIDLVNPVNKGSARTRNIGIAHATNELIFNLDSDNILSKNSIRKLKNVLISKNADIVAFSTIYYFTDYKNWITHKWIYRKEILLQDLFVGYYNPGPEGNYLFKKTAWRDVGKYSELDSGLHDTFGFTLKLLANGKKLISASNTYIFHRYGHESLFIRESQKSRFASSLMALKLVEPFIDRIDEEDATFMLSENGKKIWYENLEQRPIKLKSRPLGKDGRSVKLNSLNKLLTGLKLLLID